MSTSAKARRQPSGYGSPLGIVLFLLLPLGGYALLNVYPSLLSIYYSLNEYGGLGKMEFVGLQNFANMFQDPVVGTAVINGLRNMFLVLAIQVPFGFVLAFLLSRVAHGSKVFVLFFFLPVVVSEVVLALMWRFIYNSEWGMLNSSLRAVGLDALALKWLSNPDLAPWAVLIPGVWQWVGFNVVLFLAAIEGLPQEVLEAARMDGANGWQQLGYITLPMLRGVYVMATILAIAGSMGGPLGYPLMLTQGGPFQSSQTLSLYIYQLVSSRRAGQVGAVPLWGYASAVVLLNFALVSILSAVTWRLRRGLESE
jgi:raffinose/stachyose/melibiose transport system permease protein